MACNVAMTKLHDDAKLIDRLGGPAALARKLGFGPGGTQRVQNWKYRGIPEIELLRNPAAFRPEPASKRAAA